jgi:hypothetical protein
MNSQNPLSPALSREEDSDSIQIDLWKIVDFFIQQYLFLGLGASIGLFLGLLAWFSLSTYKVEVIVPNQWGEIVNLRTLEASWTSVAREISVESGLSSEDQSFYTTLSSTAWWKKTIRPNYALTKADLKDLVGFQEVKGVTIINLELSWSGKNSDWIEKQLLKTVEFMRFASSYTAIRNIITKYETEIFTASAVIEKDLHVAQLGLVFANRRLSNLEDLQKRFPGNSLVVNQMLDLKESGAKYLPISNQIIAAKSDIFATQESIKQLQTRLEQAQLLSQFVSQARPLMIAKERNGIKLAEQLLAIEAQLRATIAPDHLSQLVALDRIRVDLINVQTQFKNMGDQPLLPVIQRNSSWVVASAGGLLGGFFIALIICLGLQYWPALKVRLHSAKNSH